MKQSRCIIIISSMMWLITTSVFGQNKLDEKYFGQPYTSVTSGSLKGPTVDGSYTVTWPFETGAEGQTANYSGASADFFKPDYVQVGSNLFYAGSRVGNNGVTYTQFQPHVQSSTLDDANEVTFNIWPKTGLVFTPTSVEFDCERFGTGSGMIDVAWRSSNGTVTTIGTDIKPNRVNYTDGVFHATLDLSTMSIPESTGKCTLIIYISELGDTKQVGIANIAITGDISGTIEDIAVYTVNTSVSPLDAGTISSSPVGNEFDVNTEVTLTATRGFGFEFSRWIDGTGNQVSTSNPFTFTLTQDTNIVAEFIERVTYSFNLSIEGSEWGEVILSPEPTNGKYEAGTMVSATVIPNPVTSFLYWNDNKTETVKTILMDGDKTIVATFDEIPFIVGWDFRSVDPKVSRSGDFYSESTNTGNLSVYKADGSAVSWLAHSPEFSPSLPNARIWSTDFINDRRYFMASFSTELYTSIQVNAKIIASWQAYSVQKMEYSLDGTNFTKLDTIDLTAGYSASWSDFNVTLPAEAEGQSKVYIRWIADETSTILGDSDQNDGTAMSNIFIFADKEIVNDSIEPNLLATVPSNGATNASANGSIILTFDEKVIAGTGNCTLDSEALKPVFGAKTATFKYQKLAYDTEYTFTVPAGAITDQSGNAFDGITVVFRTMVRPEPVQRLFDAIVAIDSSGDYTSVQDAIDAAPTNRVMPWLIFIKNGKYEGHVFIPASKPFIHMIGQSTDSVIISDDLLAGDKGDGTPWYHVSEAATVVVYSADCYFENITFENAYGFEAQAGPQALAMYTNNDRITFKNCTLRSYQDTYLTSTNSISDRHYLKNCRIEGAVDYIYGAGDVFFDECTLYNVRPSGGYIVAPNHKEGTLWGYVFNHCILDGKDGVITYYGRPWHNSPKTVFLYSVLKCDIYSGGWYYKMGAIPAIFADYGTMDARGNLVDLSNRISEYEYDDNGTTVTGTAKNSLTDAEAATYTYENVLLRSGNNWDPKIITEAPQAPENATLNENVLNWSATPYAMCYIITRNDEVIGFTIETTFTDSTVIEGEQYAYSIEAASEYGALSERSEKVYNYDTQIPTHNDNSTVFVNSFNSGIQIYGMTGETRITIYTISGQMVKTEECHASSAQYSLSKGLYIVVTSCNKGLKTNKVVVW